ncbi:hypothetical protein SDC9_83102 [bioreactor metagenome]|uniref:6-bladed beta-propeller n=1 Tax=bioreactor metagenome TaxID=1076179 RepID=A0A644ZF58_9ZZZZ
MPIARWKTLCDTVKTPHSISSDGNVCIINSTENNGIVVFKSENRMFREIQRINSAGTYPHKIIYDNKNMLFYCIADSSQELSVLKNINGNVELVKTLKLDYLGNSFVRSIRIIDDKLFFVSGPGKIIAASYANLEFDMKEEYEVPFELYGMNDIIKIGSFYYISAYQNKNFEIKPKLVRIKDLGQLKQGNYENIYDLLDLKGVPYYFSIFDDRVFLTQIDSFSGIVSFVVDGDEIRDIRTHYDFDMPTKESLQRLKSNGTWFSHIQE